MPNQLVRVSDEADLDIDDQDLNAGLQRFRTWAHSPRYPEFGKFSYIQGTFEADPGPMNHSAHGAVLRQLICALNQLIDGNQFGQLFISGAMFVNEQAIVATHPDIMFCTWETLESGRAGLRSYDVCDSANEVYGSPDLAIEIVSADSAIKDKVRLKKAYFECGIPEYWLIDARGAQLEFNLFVRSDNEYRPVKADTDGYLLSPLFGRAFRLDRTPHPLVGFQYRLLSREGDT